jgi:hypothetical protein
MKNNLLQPILITIIAIGSLRTEEKRAELLEGNWLLWLVIIAFIISWVGYFLNKRKKGAK